MTKDSKSLLDAAKEQYEFYLKEKNNEIDNFIKQFKKYQEKKKYCIIIIKKLNKRNEISFKQSFLYILKYNIILIRFCYPIQLISKIPNTLKMSGYFTKAFLRIARKS